MNAWHQLRAIFCDWMSELYERDAREAKTKAAYLKAKMRAIVWRNRSKLATERAAK